MSYTIGLDYGTNSVRALLVSLADGKEIASSVWNYSHGKAGIILDTHNPDLARQHPQDYVDGAAAVLRAVVDAGVKQGIAAEEIIGIGVDTTGSTPMPVDRHNRMLGAVDEGNVTAMAWLWKDHCATEEARAITDAAQRLHPEYLATVGGTYSSEWFWAKLWRAIRDDSSLFDSVYTWVEIADWIPSVLAGIDDADAVVRGICAAGHKGLYHPEWGGYPEEQFLTELDPGLAVIRRTLPESAATAAHERAGDLSPDWAERTGLTAGIPIAIGGIDAHLGAVGSGIEPGRMIKNIGTSACDMMIARPEELPSTIPGICGIVPDSIVPGYRGLEAGQSAVGDIFNWLVNAVLGGDSPAQMHERLLADAAKMAPGESGLLALDWHNGNRTVLIDQDLTGLIVGLNLHTTPAQIYRALIEATAFGARIIIERFGEYGQKVKKIVTCGGIAVRNRLAMQIYADVLNIPIEISSSEQTAALGAAIAGAVAASSRGGHPDFTHAMKVMTSTREDRFTPIENNVPIYERLFTLYRQLHDAFGMRDETKGGNLFHVMKELLEIRKIAHRTQ